MIKISRNEMRKVFQPSRVVVAVAYDSVKQQYNFLPIAFNMYCGYTPLSFCFAIHDINYSYSLFQVCEEFCIAIPGADMAEVVLKAGMLSGRNIAKFEYFGLNPIWCDESNCVGIKEALVNIYCKKTAFFPVSDHAIVVGEIQAIYKDEKNVVNNLLSIAPTSDGYTHLVQHGIHTLGVASG